MRPLCSSLKTEDYTELQQHVQVLENLDTLFAKHGGGIHISHPHKLWEYASAMHALDTLFPAAAETVVLDVYPGSSILGPALAYILSNEVHELVADPSARLFRSKANSVLKQLKKPQIVQHELDLYKIDQLPQFDAVFCISVLEHMSPRVEPRAWELLASRVKEGGLLFITADVVRNTSETHVDDVKRQTYFSTALLKTRIEALELLGFMPVGGADYEYNGDYVHDYSLFRIALQNTGLQKIKKLYENEATYIGG